MNSQEINRRERRHDGQNEYHNPNLLGMEPKILNRAYKSRAEQNDLDCFFNIMRCTQKTPDKAVRNAMKSCRIAKMILEVDYRENKKDGLK